MANSEYPDDIVHAGGTSIKKKTGINRKPDVWVENAETGDVMKVYEAARTKKSGDFVTREQVKMKNYNEAKIPNHFEEVK